MMIKKEGKRKALGRGLDALIEAEAPVAEAGATRPPEAARPAEKTGVVRCGIEQITPSRFQPRRVFDEDALESLAASIKEDGVLQPLLVRPRKAAAAGEPPFELIAGERRWRAAQRAGLHEVPVIVKDVEDREALELSLVENIQREDLNPLEEAEAYKTLLESFGYTQEDLALRLGKDRSTIANSLRLLRLPQELKEDLLHGRISAGHARALMSLEEFSLQKMVRNQIIKRHISVREAERLVQRLSRKQQAAQAKGVEKESPEQEELAWELKALEERLMRALGTRVKIIPGQGQRGKIEVSYASFDELTRLILFCEGQTKKG